MLKLNKFLELLQRILKNLNTSHVKVKHYNLIIVSLRFGNLNTSHVKVKQRQSHLTVFLYGNLNTSHVKVKP